MPEKVKVELKQGVVTTSVTLPDEEYGTVNMTFGVEAYIVSRYATTASEKSYIKVTFDNK
jgi:hypothetical protein